MPAAHCHLSWASPGPQEGPYYTVSAWRVLAEWRPPLFCSVGSSNDVLAPEKPAWLVMGWRGCVSWWPLSLQCKKSTHTSTYTLKFVHAYMHTSSCSQQVFEGVTGLVGSVSFSLVLTLIN